LCHSLVQQQFYSAIIEPLQGPRIMFFPFHRFQTRVIDIVAPLEQGEFITLFA
jgi:hypothetical protein